MAMIRHKPKKTSSEVNTPHLLRLSLESKVDTETHRLKSGVADRAFFLSHDATECLDTYP